MALNLEWKYRIEHWRNLMPKLFFTPVAEVPLSAFFTFEQLTPAEAAKRKFSPIKPGTAWGGKWQYVWMAGKIVLPASVKGQRVELRMGTEADFAVYLNGAPGAERDWAHPLVTLTRKAKGGEKFDLLAEGYAGHGETPGGDGPIPFGQPGVKPTPKTQRVQGTAEIGVFHEELYQAWVDFATLLDLRGTLCPDSLRLAEIDQALMDFTVAVDVELPIDELVRQCAAGRAVLKKCLSAKNGTTAPEMYAFGHSHIDVAWLWPLRETESKCTRTFSQQLALMDEYPEYKFLQSQPHLYWMVKNHYPDLYRRILEKIKTGQWIAEGGMWVEADTNVSGGESLIRQFVMGQKFYKEELGRICEMMWLPDVFGYSGAMPQIMKGCGIKYFSTQKIFWIYNGGDGFPYVTFWWEGIDGTRVLSHFHNDYNAHTNPAALVKRWTERPQKMGINARLYPFGHGDGGGGPTRDHLEYLRREKDLEGMPRVRIEHPVKFFKDEEKKKADLPAYVGELYFQCHRGTYTSQAKTKRGNRYAEFGLREAELWAAAALTATGRAYPAAKLEDLWRGVLLNQFHDIIPGSSIGRVYEEAEKLYGEVIAGADAIAAEAAATLAPAKKNAKTFSVFNPLGWSRYEVVTLPKGVEAALDADGKPVETQKAADGATLAGVYLPPLGAAVFTAAKPGEVEVDPEEADMAAAFAATAGVTATGAFIRSETLSAKFNARGEIVSLVHRDDDADISPDRVQGRELAAGPLNAFHMWKDVPRAYDAWDIDSTYKACPVPLDGKATFRVIETGPLVARLEIKRKLHDSDMTQIVSLESGASQLTFKTTIDWKERHKLLKVNFPFALHTNEALHEIQFGHLARPNHMNRQFDADRFEVACQKWSAFVEDAYGCAILNDSKYGVNAEGNSLNLTLLKSPIQPDAEADLGRQEFTYAIYAWQGYFGDIGPVRPAYELNAPVRMVAGGGESFSVLACDDEDTTVVIEAVKAAEDGSGDLVVRLYESARRACKTSLLLGFKAKSWKETDMLEAGGKASPVRDNTIPLTFRPFEIKTVRIARQSEQ